MLDAAHPSAHSRTAAAAAAAAAAPVLDVDWAERDDGEKGGGDGWTALMAASAEGVDDVADALIAANADVNKVCADGTTPLYTAVAEDQMHVAVLLRAAGAQFSAVDVERLEAELLVSAADSDSAGGTAVADGRHQPRRCPSAGQHAAADGVAQQPHGSGAKLVWAGADPNKVEIRVDRAAAALATMEAEVAQASRRMHALQQRCAAHD